MSELKIITYHYVRDVERSNFPGIKAISTKEFKKQIDWISKAGKVITQEQLLSAYDDKVDLPKNSFLLTFDDGYIDHIENAAPVLEEYGMTGVFFLPIKGIIERELLDANKIQHVLGGRHDVNEIINKIFSVLGDYREKHGLRSNDEYWEVCAKPGRFDGPEIKFVKSMLQFELPSLVRRDILDVLFREYVSSNQQAFADELYLSIDAVDELIAKGMEIASHGYEHVRLGLLNADEQETEIKKAVGQFGKLGINKQSWTMCYPYGSYTKDTKDILHNYGCKAGYATKGGVTKIDETNRFEINRMDATELAEDLKEVNLTTAKLGQV